MNLHKLLTELTQEKNKADCIPGKSTEHYQFFYRTSKLKPKLNITQDELIDLIDIGFPATSHKVHCFVTSLEEAVEWVQVYVDMLDERIEAIRLEEMGKLVDAIFGEDPQP